jgi:hypothetical protein
VDGVCSTIPQTDSLSQPLDHLLLNSRFSFNLYNSLLSNIHTITNSRLPSSPILSAYIVEGEPFKFNLPAQVLSFVGPGLGMTSRLNTKCSRAVTASRGMRALTARMPQRPAIRLVVDQVAVGKILDRERHKIKNQIRETEPGETKREKKIRALNPKNPSAQ